MKTIFNIIGLLGLCSLTFMATFALGLFIVQFFIEMPFVTVGVLISLWGIIWMFTRYPDDDIRDLLE